MNDWLLPILAVSFFYSLGQVYIRSCNLLSVDYRSLIVYYYLINGIFGIFLYLYFTHYETVSLEVTLNTFTTIFMTVFLFAVGTIFLIYSIYCKANLGILNTVRTSTQVILTVLLGYIYFREMITMKQFLGVIVSLLGIALIL
jgi:drug/metabolite transporter (DMT)-like permease